MSSLRTIALPLVGLLLLVPVSAVFIPRFSELLDVRYMIYWDVNSTHITVYAQVDAIGYVGFGLSTQQHAMSPGDVCIGYVDGQRSYFGGYHTQGHSEPTWDAQQDWHLLSIEENQGTTTMIFTRKLITGDVKDIPIHEGETMNVIYAASNSDPMASRFGHHSFRGAKRIVLAPTGSFLG